MGKSRTICYLVLLVFAFVMNWHAQGQALKQSSFWFIPGKLSIDFKSDPPSLLHNGGIISGGGRSSTICDENGNLLFYTLGDTIWNRYHQVMQNGADLYAIKGGNPVTSIIVPHPGDGQLYYVFIALRGIVGFTWPEGFHYSVVDMSGDNGKGSVIQKKVNLISRVTCLLTVAPHADEKSFWVITHGLADEKFYSFHVSELGIVPPVISGVGPIYSDDSNQLKASPDGTKLAVTEKYKSTYLYDFDSKTGKISNPKFLKGAESMGIEFSPNSIFLYLSSYSNDRGGITQFDVGSNDIAKILASETRIGLHRYEDACNELQLAYNGKIYGPMPGNHISEFDSLVVINKPNVGGMGCEFRNDGLWLPYALQSYLPTSVQSFYRQSAAVEAFKGCKNLPSKMRATSLGYADSLLWSFGDGEDQMMTEDLAKIVTHTYSQTGMYPIKVKKYIGTLYREISTSIQVVEKATFSLGLDTMICKGNEMILDVGQNFSKYNWSTGETSRSIQVQKAGEYSVVVDNGGCTSEDAIKINVFEYPIVSALRDTVVCNDSFTLSTFANSDYTYRWSNNATTNSIVVKENGAYQVIVSNGKCSSIAKSNVQFRGIKDLSLPDSLVIPAYGEEVFIQATGKGIDEWQWHFGDDKNETTNTPYVYHQYSKSGHYIGKILASNIYGCKGEDYFEIVFPEYRFIPNVFTPNNDLYNDVFEVQYNGIENFSFEIYDRWGDKIFYSPQGAPWDGGNSSPGIYYYQVNFDGGNSFKGWVMLIK